MAKVEKRIKLCDFVFCMNDYAQISISASLVGLEDYSGPVSEISEAYKGFYISYVSPEMQCGSPVLQIALSKLGRD
jgi:hypothetical protein